ncbi:MAG: hypothetical protein K1X53_09245, partial [Candidatus Sumerlaeaceae bacterium]|nr:hypothetical protein [Candidatus Sumerlaeaceae bacterium]
MTNSAPYKLHIISHTHWDREWYLSLENFRSRLVDLIDNLLDILDNDPNFLHFHLDGQTVVLEDYLEIRPAQRERLSRHISSGRILIGPWYLQNDEFLTTGESTIRNLLLGRRICRADFGVEPMPIGYVPDQFGNISQLPQILRGFAIQSAIFGRGYDRSAGAEFFWKSPDGSKVLAVFLIQWYNNLQRLPRKPADAIAMIRELMEGQKGQAHTRHLMMMNGVDHLEAQENLSEIINDVNALDPGFQLVHSTLPNYVEAVRAELPAPQTVAGEFRWGDNGGVIPSTASSRVHLKQSNFRLQQELQSWVEPFAVLASLFGSRYKAGDMIDYAWKTLMQCHPHDSICGCSIDEVHFQMEGRFSRVSDVLADQLSRSLRHLAAGVDSTRRGHHSTLTVFNPLPCSRSEVFETNL